MSETPETDWERRKRLAEVFGDALPETTQDERASDAPPVADEAAQEKWLQEQVPPHHGS